MQADVFIVQAGEAWTALREGQALAATPGVRVCYPVIRQTASLPGGYAPAPNDPYYNNAWPLDQRKTNGSVAGATLNVRPAWAVTKGAGVTLALGDTGVELTHPDLQARTTGAPHADFGDGTTNGMPPMVQIAFWAHGTEVAGLAAATANNALGSVGVAPEARLASWGVFQANRLLTSDSNLMAMYQYRPEEVAVQNHSWGHSGVQQNAPTLLEHLGISNAVFHGRGGRGVVMVRSCGNDRQSGGSADDDGYTADPRVIAVGAVRNDGRVTSYSEPGACLLVAAPSGDDTTPKLFTTDLTGTNGINFLTYLPPTDTNLNGYVFDAQGFSGTSAASPQVAGLAALLLAANSNLTVRDVQQILVLASRHFDLKDPDLRANGAGLLVSHNAGFGVPDAAWAVELARHWSNRPPAANVTLDLDTPAPIPDGGLRLWISATNDVPTNLQALVCLPGTGVFADEPTAALPLVDVGSASRITANLTNKAALILRTNLDWVTQLNRAVAAGAGLAVVRNGLSTNATCPGGESLCPLLRTDFVPIPCVFIRLSDGEALKAQLALDTNTLAQIRLEPARFTFTVTNTLVCEHVGLRLRTDHSLRGDLRVTLRSPMGTRSMLQRLNQDTNAGPQDWTYSTTHHFFEGSAGSWTLEVSDQFPKGTGSVLSASLILSGVPIADSDGDGLDDAWEVSHFGSLASGPMDDPDRDGASNAREQILGTNPTRLDTVPQPELSRLFGTRWRLAWPATTNRTYEVWTQTNVAAPLLLLHQPARPIPRHGMDLPRRPRPAALLPTGAPGRVVNQSTSRP